MLAKNLLLLSVFAGGCLSGALAVALSASEAEPPNAGAAAQPADQAAHSPAVSTSGERDETPERAPDTRADDPGTEVSRHDTDLPEPASSRSVADVLVRLETAYRDMLAEPVRAPESMPAAAAVPAPESVPRAPVAAAVPAPDLADRPEPAPAIATTMKSAPAAPQGEAPASSSDAIASAPSMPTRDAPASTVTHTQQTVHIGNLVQGDLYQVQQLALLQYLQLLALSPQTRIVAPAPPRPEHPGVFGHSTHSTPGRRKPAFPTSVTNPDNPWGFDFPAPMLAK